MINNNLNIKFDFVLFYAAVESFKKNRLDFIFKSVKEVVNSKSIIFTYTIVEDEHNQHYLLDYHEIFFKDKL